MVTKILSLTETSVQNLLTARAKSLLHTSKKKRLNCHDVTATMSDRNTVQKMQNTKYLLKLFLWPAQFFYGQRSVFLWPAQRFKNCVFLWPAQLKNGQIFRNCPWNGQSGNPHMDCHKSYQPYPMVCYKPYSTVKQADAHARRLGVQSARSTQRGKHNRTLTLPRFNL